MGDDYPEYTMRKRVGNPWDRIRLRILLSFNRVVLTGLVSIGVFICFLLIGATTPFRQFMTNMGPTRYMFQAQVGGLITGVTLVVTINQLVLSREIGSLGDQRVQMSDAMGFRDDAEDFFGSISPPEPESFLQTLIATTCENAEELERTITDNDNRELTDEVSRFTDHLIEHGDVVTEKLEGRTFGEYEVIKAALDYNYSEKIYQVRRIRDEYGDELSDEGYQALIDLLQVLSFFGPAREYIKNLYFQWELVDLSRNIIYSTIPALIVTGTLAVYLSPTMFPGETLGIDQLIWIVSVGVTIGFIPFLLLSMYVLRLATIAKRTLAIGPFILRESERPSE